MNLNKLSRLFIDYNNNQWEYNFEHSPYTVEYLKQRYKELKRKTHSTEEWMVYSIIKKHLTRDNDLIGGDVQRWLHLDEIPPIQFLELLQVEDRILQMTYEMDIEEYNRLIKQDFTVTWFRHQMNPMVDSKVLLPYPMDIHDCIIHMRSYQQRYYQTDRCSQWISVVIPKILSYHVNIRTGDIVKNEWRPLKIV